MHGIICVLVCFPFLLDALTTLSARSVNSDIPLPTPDEYHIATLTGQEIRITTFNPTGSLTILQLPDSTVIPRQLALPQGYSSIQPVGFRIVLTPENVGQVTFFQTNTSLTSSSRALFAWNTGAQNWEIIGTTSSITANLASTTSIQTEEGVAEIYMASIESPNLVTTPIICSSNCGIPSVCDLLPGRLAILASARPTNTTCPASTVFVAVRWTTTAEGVPTASQNVIGKFLGVWLDIAWPRETTDYAQRTVDIEFTYTNSELFSDTELASLQDGIQNTIGFAKLVESTYWSRLHSTVVDLSRDTITTTVTGDGRFALLGEFAAPTTILTSTSAVSTLFPPNIYTQLTIPPQVSYRARFPNANSNISVTLTRLETEGTTARDFPAGIDKLTAGVKLSISGNTTVLVDGDPHVAAVIVVGNAGLPVQTRKPVLSTTPWPDVRVVYCVTSRCSEAVDVKEVPVTRRPDGTLIFLATQAGIYTYGVRNTNFQRIEQLEITGNNYVTEFIADGQERDILMGTSSLLGFRCFGGGDIRLEMEVASDTAFIEDEGDVPTPWLKLGTWRRFFTNCPNFETRISGRWTQQQIQTASAAGEEGQGRNIDESFVTWGTRRDNTVGWAIGTASTTLDQSTNTATTDFVTQFSEWALFAQEVQTPAVIPAVPAPGGAVRAVYCGFTLAFLFVIYCVCMYV